MKKDNVNVNENPMVYDKPDGFEITHNEKDNDNEKGNEEVGRFASYAEYRKAMRWVNKIFTKK